MTSWKAFIGKRKAMEQAVAEIVSPSDSPEVKLQKIYARVQQIRNTSYEAEKTEQEQKREKEKDPDNVETIWKKQYGDRRRTHLAFSRPWLAPPDSRLPACGFPIAKTISSLPQTHGRTPPRCQCSGREAERKRHLLRSRGCLYSLRHAALDRDCGQGTKAR